MGALYVTSLGNGAGKTIFCAGLAHLLSQQGNRPGLFKAVSITSSATDDPQDDDARFFARMLGESPSASWPVAIESQEAEQGLTPQARERVLSAFREVSSQANPVLVEGPSMAADGGQATGLVPDLAQALDAKAVLLVRATPALGAAAVAGPARSLGDRLLGVVVNGASRYQRHALRESVVAPLEEQGIPVLGVLPESRFVGMGVSVGQLAEHLKGAFLSGEDKREQLVDHVMLGGLVLDWGVRYFGQSDTKAVVVRGDRPDIQMAALNTPTRCLVLTGGHRPIQYVKYEAREEDVPVVLVEGSTLDTAKALETLFGEARACHPEKAERFAGLLSEWLDLDALDPVLG